MEFVGNYMVVSCLKCEGVWVVVDGDMAYSKLMEALQMEGQNPFDANVMIWHNEKEECPHCGHEQKLPAFPETHN